MKKFLIPILAVVLCAAVAFAASVLSDSPAETTPPGAPSPQTGSHAGAQQIPDSPQQTTDPQVSDSPETVYTADETSQKRCK